jgi:TonB family protein
MEPPIREPSPVSSDPPPPVLDGKLHLGLGGDFGTDDLEHYRRREAAWVSIAVHVVLVLLLLLVPKWVPKGPVLVPVQPKDQSTFLDLPRAPVTVKPPKTNIISDQNRMAQSRTPVPDKETLRKLIDAQRPGPPKAVNPPPQPAQQQQQVAQAQPAPQPQQGTQSVPAQPQQSAKLQAPPQPKQNPFAIASAGSSVDQAIRNAANNPVHSSTSFGSGHYGSGLRPKVDTAGNFDILSDTMGVDFGPYMQRLKVTVQDHWEPLIPEAALPPMMKKGRVVVEFAILKDGTIQGMRMVAGSGDVALDRAAWGALTSSIPLPRLPVQFSGDYLLIRAAFYYNPDKNDFE